MKVRLSDKAYRSLTEIAVALPEAYVAMRTIIKSVQCFELKGEEMIAVLNDHHDLYLLEPERPGVPMLVVFDPDQPDECVITDVGRFSASDRYQKKLAATTAAKSIGIVPANIYVVP